MPIDAADAMTKENAAKGNARSCVGAEFHHDAGEQHRTRCRCGDVTGRRPGVQRPDTREYGEPDEQHGKRPRLKLRCELKLRELLKIERSSGHVRGDDSDEDERASEEGIKRELHRAVLLVRRSPDRDQEIFWNDHELVEEEEEEEIGAEKDAIRAADHKKKPKEEFVRPMFNVPREKDRGDGNDTGDESHRQADAIDGEMVIHSKHWYPRHAHDRLEGRKIDNRYLE